MKFEKYFPDPLLQPYIRYFIVSENNSESEYKVFPSAGLVTGFQYKGKLSEITIIHQETILSTAGITGISDSYKIFRNSAGTGTILVYFTETGLACFTTHPLHELFNQSISLEYIFDKNSIAETEERLSSAHTDAQRIKVIERFFISQLKDIQTDKLIIEAVKLIYQSNGNIRISELNKVLLISQSPFEKRFRKLVGTTPKKFASIIRFNTVVKELNSSKSLSEICYKNHFFDQAHFIKDFKQYTGDTPDKYKRFL